MTYPSNRKILYRRGVGIILLNSAGKVFVAKRIDHPSSGWQLPQGGIERGETPVRAAFREMMEEIGTANAEIIAKSRLWYHYDLPEALRATFYKGKYAGQRQKWFLFRFLGSDTTINIDTHQPEFSAWQWANIHDIPDMVVSFKQQLYRNLVQEFASMIPGYVPQRL